MSRAYCLTCNEQVTETPAGTCPSGHPVTTDDVGPEPWVGFVGDDPAPARPPVEAATVAPPLSRIDAAGQPMAHAVNGHASGHVNGNGRSLGGGQGANDPFPSTFGHRSSFTTDEAAARTERAPASGQASDDLAALLAEALGSSTPPAEDAADEGAGLFDHAPAAEAEAAHEPPPVPPSADEPAPTPPASDEDWGDLASLAAELQLDADTRDEAPAAAHDPVASAPDAAVPDTPGSGDELAADDLDALMAELTGDPLPAEDAPAMPEEPAAANPAEEVADEPAAAMPAPSWDPVPPGDAPPPPEPVPSAPPAPESVAPWDTPSAPVGDHSPWEDPSLLEQLQPDPSPYDDVPEAPAADTDAAPVDLSNFTASGRRVGRADAAGAGSKNKKFGRKKR